MIKFSWKQLASAVGCRCLQQLTRVVDTVCSDAACCGGWAVENSNRTETKLWKVWANHFAHGFYALISAGNNNGPDYCPALVGCWWEHTSSPGRDRLALEGRGHFCPWCVRKYRPRAGMTRKYTMWSFGVELPGAPPVPPKCSWKWVWRKKLNNLGPDITHRKLKKSRHVGKRATDRKNSK